MYLWFITFPCTVNDIGTRLSGSGEYSPDSQERLTLNVPYFQTFSRNIVNLTLIENFQDYQFSTQWNISK